MRGTKGGLSLILFPLVTYDHRAIRSRRLDSFRSVCIHRDQSSKVDGTLGFAPPKMIWPPQVNQIHCLTSTILCQASMLQSPVDEGCQMNGWVHGGGSNAMSVKPKQMNPAQTT